MLKFLVVLGLGVFIGGCDQSVLAPLDSGGSEEPWTENQRETNFFNSFRGHWTSYCALINPGSFKNHIEWNEGRGSLTINSYKDNACSYLEHTKSRAFKFRTLGAYEFNDHVPRYFVKIVFEQVDEGEVSWFTAVIFSFANTLVEERRDLRGLKNGKEVPVTGVFSYFEYEKERQAP